jgi:hypothetical protein
MVSIRKRVECSSCTVASSEGGGGRGDPNGLSKESTSLL